MLRKFKNLFGNSWERDSRCTKNERWEATRGNFTYKVNITFSSLNILLKEWLLSVKAELRLIVWAKNGEGQCIQERIRRKLMLVGPC